MAKGIPMMGRDPDGKAKMINVDENGNVKVLQSGIKVLGGVGARYYVKKRNVAPDSFVTIKSWDAGESIELVGLSMACSSRNKIFLEIAARDKSGDATNYIQTVENDGSAWRPISMAAISAMPSPFFEIMVDDETLNQYKFKLKKPLWMPNGGVVRLRSASSSTESIPTIVEMWYREVAVNG